MDEAPQWTGAQASRQPAWGAVISMSLGSGPINMAAMVGLICADTRSKAAGRLYVFQGLATK